MTHAREQIRERATTVLTGLSLTGSNVFESHVYPLGEDQLPGLCVYTLNQNSEIVAVGGGSPILEHQLELAVAIYVKETDTYDDTLDAILVDVEKALNADSTLNGLVKFIYPQSLDVNLTGEGDKPVVVATQSFQVIYRTAMNDPETTV